MGLYLHTLLFPDSSVANGTAAVGAASVWQALDDQLDTSYVYQATSNQGYLLTLSAPAALPAFSQITGVKALVRASRPTVPSGVVVKWTGTLILPGVGLHVFQLNNLLSAINWWDSPIYALRPNGQPWTVADLNALTTTGSGGDHARVLAERARIYEVFIEVYINRAPTATPLSPLGLTTTSTRPAFIFDYIDEDNDLQERVHIKVFSGLGAVANPETETARLVLDSGVVFSGLEYYQFAASLTADADYRWAVKVADAGSNGAFGPWAQESFTITIARPPIPTATVVTQQALNRYDIRPVAGTGGAATDFFVVERSENSGRTWEYVQGGSAVLAGSLTEDESSFETSLAGWIAGSGLVAGYPQRSSNFSYLGLWSLRVNLADSVGEVLLDTFKPATPGVTYEAVLGRRAGSSAAGVKISFLWYNVDLVLLEVATHAPLLDNNISWQLLTFAATAPPTATQYKIKVTWNGVAGSTHYIDRVTVGPIISDYRSSRLARPTSAPNLLLYRITAGRFLLGLETVLGPPVLADVSPVLVNDCKTWLKHPSRPALNMVINDTANMKTTSTEDMAAHAAAGRPDWAVFSGTVRLPTGQIDMIHLGDAQEAAFNALRGTQDPLLLQTVYGDTVLKQMWVRLGPDLAVTWVTVPNMETLSYTRASIGFWVVAAPTPT